MERSHRTLCILSLSLLALVFLGEDRWQPDPVPAPRRPTDPLALVLAAEAPDPEIARLLEAVRNAEDPFLPLERLGWRLVRRARLRDEDRWLVLAERAARAMQERRPASPAAALLLGRALHGQHRFAEARAIAMNLVERRGFPVDFGLLGDALLDQGEIGLAAEAYQRMMDLKPDAHAYTRAARARHATGDAEGALDAMRVAARAASPRDSEAFAWIWSRLALYELEAGNHEIAERHVAQALAAQPDSLPALRAARRVHERR